MALSSLDVSKIQDMQMHTSHTSCIMSKASEAS